MKIGINISNLLYNECENIYAMLYNFLLGGRDADIIYLNYKKEMGCFNQIVSDDYSKTPFLIRSTALF